MSAPHARLNGQPEPLDGHGVLLESVVSLRYIRNDGTSDHRGMSFLYDKTSWVSVSSFVPLCHTQEHLDVPKDLPYHPLDLVEDGIITECPMPNAHDAVGRYGKIEPTGKYLRSPVRSVYSS